MKATKKLRRKVKFLNATAKIIAAPIVFLIYLASPIAYLFGMAKAVFDIATGRI